MAVFPLKPKEKKPLTAHGVKDATTDFDTITKWWKKNPNANIGIACGQISGGLLVIDLDERPNGVSGFDSLHEWESEHGELPETARTITGKGGSHILYHVDHKENNRVDLLDGVDVRSDGGYIVAPPSIHPNGKAYEWEYDPEEYGIADANENVLDLLSVGKKKVEVESFTAPDKIPDGKRNDTIFKLACSLQSKGLGDGSILAACLAENNAKCNPPLDDAEVGKIVESALRHEKGTKAYPSAAVGLDLLTVTDSKGNEKVRQCAENVARVILNDPALANKIKEDTFGHRLVYFGQLDWRRNGDNYGEWSDKDDGALESYLDIKYGLRNKNDYTNGFNMALLENEFNPLQSYLDALEWDGVPRIDEALHKYLGVKKTEYNLAAFRVFLQGAIHRAYDPGCKFDYMMVLIGKQGDGKSTLFKFLACNDDWYDENFNFKDTNNKATVEKMAGKWFLEMGEMDTMKKDMVTSDALKAFVSSVSDDYRVPFAKRKETRKRQCVFCGTSNDINFLKDRTGNRRYLPIDCNATNETKRRIFDYDTARPYFQQVIAEAVAEYKSAPDKKPVLPFDLEEQAKREQLAHLEEDVWVSIIQDYLDNELVGRVNAAYIYEKAFGKDPVDMRKGEAGRILTIMRNDIVGWHEIGKARLNGYGKRGICFERDEMTPNEAEGGSLGGAKVAVGGTEIGFEEVTKEEIFPF